MPDHPPIPYGRQSLDDADIASVTAVLRSDFLTQGPAVPAFEKALAKLCRVRHGVAVASATSALHIACLALDLGPGDLLWTSPITFVASANCALYCGASVDFVDIDPITRNLCPDALERKLIGAKQAGRLPKIVVPVHFSGLPCDMAAIHALSRDYGFRIIEDASHAIGASHQDESVGNCRYSDITVFSFHPVKIITTGEGGMAVTNDDTLAERMRNLRSHGITRDPSMMKDGSDGPWYYELQELGFNYRMTDMQAALGLSQIQRLDSFIERRTQLAQRYTALLTDLPCICPSIITGITSAWHLYVIEWIEEQSGCSRLDLFQRLRKADIGVNVHYIPVYRQPYYQQFGYRNADFPYSERYYQRAISLPLYPNLSDDQQDYVVHVIQKMVQG
jgi:UDP-4-amino-4,6-dideoxy-N-acetyl-beta-L-altrosamine transaminase